MDLRGWLVFVHITGAILYVGSSLMLTVSAFRARRDETVAEFLHVAEATAAVPALGSILLLLSGIGLILAVEAWGITSGFVLIGIGVIAISGTTESLYFGREMQALRALIGAPGRSPAVGAKLTRILLVAVVVDALFLLAVWAMVFKPGA